MSLAFASVACNRVTQGLDIHPSGIVAYCAASFVAIYDGSHVVTLKGHSATVTCLSFISQDYLLSGSNDKKCILWKRCNNEWVFFQELVAHTDGVVAIGKLTAVDQGKDVIFATTDSVGDTFIWKICGDAAEIVQKISTGPQLYMAICLSYLPESRGASN